MYLWMWLLSTAAGSMEYSAQKERKERTPVPQELAVVAQWRCKTSSMATCPTVSVPSQASSLGLIP